jgi:nicotinamide-nucleotide amidase
MNTNNEKRATLAAIVTIGDELLIGQVVDTNSAWIAQKLNLLGIPVYRMTSVSDAPNEIAAVIDELRPVCDLIIITGGLGPTRDDKTKQTLCNYFNTHLVQNDEVLAHIERLLAKRNIPMNELNVAQAMLPETCEVLFNPLGTAAGMWLEKDNTVVVSMPGVPFEMKAIVEQNLIPKLKKNFKTQAIVHKTIITSGIAESVLAQQLNEWETSLPEHIHLAYLPSPGQVRLRLSAYGNDEHELQNEIEKISFKLNDIIPANIVAWQDEAIEVTIGKLLKDKNLTVGFAESCTGGNVAHLITSVAGSSAYFKGSVVVYSNELKNKLLNVPFEVLNQYGAVSKETVEILAKEARNLLNTDFAIAISGVAGPDGGTAEKPVGTVWFALASEKEVVAEIAHFGDDRERNIQKASIFALNLLRKHL